MVFEVVDTDQERPMLQPYAENAWAGAQGELSDSVPSAEIVPDFNKSPAAEQ